MLPFIDKLYGLFPRLCLVYHAIRSAAMGREAIEPEISLETAERVFRYVRDCVLPHAHAFYGSILGGDHGRIHGLRQICTWIVCRDKPQATITRREIELNCREAWYPEGTKLYREGVRKELLSELISSGWLRIHAEADKVSKLPSEFLVNPEVDVRYAAMRAVEKPKREATYRRLQEQKAAKAAQGREPGEEG
jgi:hypothetical protein